MRGKNLFGLCLFAMLFVSLAPINLGFASPDPIMLVSPDVKPTNPEQAFTIGVDIMDAVDIFGWEFKITWDFDLTEFPPTVEEGNFLSDFGATAGVFVREDFPGGYIQVTNNLIVNTTASGEGTLCSVTFEVKESGVSDLDLYDTKLFDIDYNLIPHDVSDGLFYTTAPLVVFDWSPIEILPGDTVTFNATGCFDPDNFIDSTPGPIADYAWDFGDGSAVEHGLVVTHAFSDYRYSPYPVTLTVTDDDDDVWSKTKGLRIWRDMAVVDIWPTDYYWDEVYSDVYRNMVDPHEGIPYIEILVSVANLGSITETYDFVLYADLDAGVIGDEVTIDAYSAETAAGSTSMLWTYWIIGLDVVEDCGLYTLTAIIESPGDQDTANDVLQGTLYVHARGEASANAAPLSPRHFKIKSQGDTFKFKGKVANVEDPARPLDGIWARVAFDVLDEMGVPIGTFRTDAVYLLNGEESDLLVATWEGLTEADVGSYHVASYCEFGWDGVDFPFEGLRDRAYSFTIVP